MTRSKSGFDIQATVSWFIDSGVRECNETQSAQVLSLNLWELLPKKKTKAAHGKILNPHFRIVKDISFEFV